MKKLLAIMGSPRKGKNTDTVLDKVLEGIDKDNVEITKVYLRDLEMNPCVACDACTKTGKCCIRDDMSNLYDKFNHSDGIIIASPVYFNTVSSLTKIMIDRCQVYWSSKYVLKNPSIDRNKKRIGMFIATGGAPNRKEQFDGCFPVMDLFFRAVNTEYKHNILVSNTDKEQTWTRQDILDKAYKMGVNYFK